MNNMEQFIKKLVLIILCGLFFFSYLTNSLNTSSAFVLKDDNFFSYQTNTYSNRNKQN